MTEKTDDVVLMQRDFNDKNFRVIAGQKFMNLIPVHAYVISGKNDKVMIVDTAMTEADGKLIKEVVGDREVEYIVITHSHPDHIGNAKSFKKEMKDAKIIVHKIENESLKDGLSTESTGVYFGIKMMMGMMKVFEGKKRNEKLAVDGDIVLEFDDEGKITQGMPEEDEKNLLENYGVRILWTPGHTEGSISVYNEELKYIVVGDLVSKFFFSKGWGTHFLVWNQEVYHKTIKKICDLDPENLLIFPAHVEHILLPKMLVEKFKL